MRLRLGFIALIIVTLSVNWQPVGAQTDGARYFPETGHWLSGDFLTKYESVPDPVLAYGYPITDAFVTQSMPQSPGITVQYFQRARFEQHPENPEELRVVLSPLGEYLYDVFGPGQPVEVPGNTAACRRIPEFGHLVCYSFLQFYNANGGIAQFGYPVSDMEIAGGRLVQYFQRARFEWHPELPSGQRVTLTNVGDLYFDLVENSVYRNPSQGDFAATVLSLNVRAFALRAVMPSSGTQVLYVIVQDQTYQPVPNAQVVFDIRLPSGRQRNYIMPLSDEHGITYLPFDIQDESLGIAEITIRVNTNNLQDQTHTSFRIWY